MRRFLMVTLLCGPLIPLNSGYSAPRSACLNDAKKLCASVIHDDEARRGCMREHSAELSEGCKAAVAAERGADGGKLATCRKLAREKYYIDGGRRLNTAVPHAVARCMKGGPGAI